MGPNIHFRRSYDVYTSRIEGRGIHCRSHRRQLTTQQLRRHSYHNQNPTIPHELHGEPEINGLHLQKDGPTSW